MAKYRRLFVYRRNTLVAQTSFVGKNLTVEYDIKALVSRDLTILYDILKVNARSLWEPKEVGQAWWEAPLPENPTDHTTINDESVAESFVLDQSGSFLLDQGSGFVLAG